MGSKNAGALVESKAYAEASRKMDSFMRRLRGARSKGEVIAIRDEQALFFEGLKKSDPDLYEAFIVDRKTLAEMILKKVAGQDIIID